MYLTDGVVLWVLVNGWLRSGWSARPWLITRFLILYCTDFPYAYRVHRHTGIWIIIEAMNRAMISHWSKWKILELLFTTHFRFWKKRKFILLWSVHVRLLWALKKFIQVEVNWKSNSFNKNYYRENNFSLIKLFKTHLQQWKKRWCVVQLLQFFVVSVVVCKSL